MKAFVINGSQLQWTEFENPVAEPGEFLVDVSAVALTNLLKAQAAGTHYSSTSTSAFVPGMDGVGRLADGRRVYFIATRKPFGGLAQKSLTREGFFVPLPDELSDLRAAAIANPAMSSWAALTKRAVIRSGETVLINGATGASGKMAIQIAKHLGAKKVIATGRSSAALALLTKFGADEIITLDSDFASKAAAVVDQVDIVLDYLWGSSAETLLNAIGGVHSSRPIRYVQIGSISGGSISMPAFPFRATGLALMGSGLGSVSNRDLIDVIGQALQVAEKIGLHVDLSQVPVEEAAARWNLPGSDRIIFKVTR